MTITAIGGMPLIQMGMAHRSGLPALAALGNTTLDAANEACIMIGYVVTDDGASHTINTTGSSSLGWRTGTSTFANAGTTVVVGLAAVDTANGPPARAVNSTNVITPDVSVTLTGGAGITSAAWNESVPTSGSKTIANGDLVAFFVQMTARAGADSVLVSANATAAAAQVLPCVTNFAGSYADSGRVPNAVITFSDGTHGFFFGANIASVGTTTQTYNSGSSPNEYGNLFQAPFPMNVYGIQFAASLAGNAEAILYSDPLGTPAAAKTVALDLNVQGTAGTGAVDYVLFPAPYSVAANTPVAAILRPTTVTNVSMLYKTYHAAAHQKSEVFGTNGYAVNRASGAFAPQNSSKDRFTIGLLVGAFDDGASVGGLPASRLQLGM